jgi:hypothetical protein
MKVRSCAVALHVFFLAVSISFLAGCAGVEKRVDLTYGTAANARGGSGEVFLAKPVVEVPLQKMPGSTVLGTVRNTGTQILTKDDVSGWVMGALGDELRHAGYDTRTGSVLPAGVRKGIQARVTGLSTNQDDKGLILTTTTEMELSVEIWKEGRLVKTLTARTSTQDEGLDRTGEPVGASLRRVLQSAMFQLMPGMVDTLGGR